MERFEEDLFPPGVEDPSLWWDLTSGSGADSSAGDKPLSSMTYAELEAMREQALSSGDVPRLQVMLSEARKMDRFDDTESKWMHLIDDCSRDIQNLSGSPGGRPYGEGS